ncbi:MAG: asparaginase [Rhodospirillales bacterium]|nr:asparaginase [Rhodospirillales bacterium]
MPPESATAVHVVASPILVEVRRGAMVESRHRGAIAIVDLAGRVVEVHGDIDSPVYPRSAIKPLQAIPLVESGAAEAFGLSDAELALACASHGGEPRHVETVAGVLARLGLSEDDLECGAHFPMHAPSANALIRAGRAPGPLHNNCSGKHAGMLAACCHFGEPITGYIRRIAAAMLAEPFMLAGSGRFCTRATEIAGGKAILKTGAEGVYMAAIPAKGFGIALKIEDGAARAAEVALAKLLARFADLDRLQRAALRELIEPAVVNAAGLTVGAILPAPTW